MEGDGDREQRERGEEREMKERRNKGRKRFPSSLELPSARPATPQALNCLFPLGRSLFPHIVW